MLLTLWTTHPRTRGLAVWAVVLWVILAAAAPGASAQQPTRTAGTQANLFATVDPSRAIDGVRLDVPEDWAVEAVHLLRYGTRPLPVRLRRSAPTTVLALTDAPTRGPHELVVQVRLPDATGRRSWTVQPLVRASGSDEAGALRAVGRQSHDVSVVPPSTLSPSNHALSFEAARGPVLLRGDALPSLRGDAAFTVEFWMRTTGLGEVVLSSWNGDDTVPYAAEFYVDRGGRLRLYSGQPGEHQSLWSRVPVADGAWHHVAAVYDADRARLRLALDGTIVDSLRGYRPPSASSARSLALGGRVPVADREADQAHQFTGYLDEVRLWGRARPHAALRGGSSGVSSTKADVTGSDTDEPFHLEFDEAPDATGEFTAVNRWPDGVRQVASTLSFRAPLRNLRAQSDGSAVTLQWTARRSDESTYVVERSTDRQSFEPIARLHPEDARPASSAEDAIEYTYTDTAVPKQVVFYRVRWKTGGETAHTSPMIKVGLGASAADESPVELMGNVPNPFTETTTIAYRVRSPTPVTLSVWTVTGTRVTTLVDRHHDPGSYEQTFDASGEPSGSYFVRLNTPKGTQSRRIVLLK